MRALLADHGDRTAGGERSADGVSGPGAIGQHGPQMFTSLSLLIAPRQGTLSVADGPVWPRAVRDANPRPRSGGLRPGP